MQAKIAPVFSEVAMREDLVLSRAKTSGLIVCGDLKMCLSLLYLLLVNCSLKGIGRLRWSKPITLSTFTIVLAWRALWSVFSKLCGKFSLSGKTVNN